MPSQANSDPRHERKGREYSEGRDCPVCWGSLLTDRSGPWRFPSKRANKRYCSTRCRMFAWRRNGDPDGPLDSVRGRNW